MPGSNSPKGRVMRLFKRAAVVAAAAVLTIGVVATPASAWVGRSESCHIQEFLPFASCTTSSIEADPILNKVWFGFYGSSCPLQWRVRDTGNGNVVSSGVSYGESLVVGGLYGWYRLELSRTGGIDCGGGGLIQNYAFHD